MEFCCTSYCFILRLQRFKCLLIVGANFSKVLPNRRYLQLPPTQDISPSYIDTWVYVFIFKANLHLLTAGVGSVTESSSCILPKKSTTCPKSSAVREKWDIRLSQEAHNSSVVVAVNNCESSHVCPCLLQNANAYQTEWIALSWQKQQFCCGIKDSPTIGRCLSKCEGSFKAVAQNAFFVIADTIDWLPVHCIVTANTCPCLGRQSVRWNGDTASPILKLDTRWLGDSHQLHAPAVFLPLFHPPGKYPLRCIKCGAVFAPESVWRREKFVVPVGNWTTIPQFLTRNLCNTPTGRLRPPLLLTELQLTVYWSVAA